MTTPPASVTPLLLTPKNVRAAIGVEWRWCVELASRHGIEVLQVRGKRLLPAGPILAAIQAEAAATRAAEPPVDDEDAILAQMRRGLWRRQA